MNFACTGMRSIALFILVFPFLLAAQGPSPTKTAGKCSIKGKILNSQTDATLSKATLILEHWEKRQTPAYKATSDSDGHFAFGVIEPGQYHLWAEHMGFVGGSYGSRGRGVGAILVLRADDHLTDLVIRLTPQGAVTGRVVDEDGDPLSPVQIRTMVYRYTRSGRELRLGGPTTTTNDLGEYRLYGLAPGQYYIAAIPASGALDEGSVSQSNLRVADASVRVLVPTLYPGTASPRAATSLEITSGAEVRGIDFRLVKTPAVGLRGKIINFRADCLHSGMPPMVSLRPDDPSGTPLWRGLSATIDAQGGFEIAGVVPGVYRLQAGCYDRTRNYSAVESISVGREDLDNISLTFAPTPEFLAKVRGLRPYREETFR